MFKFLFAAVFALLTVSVRADWQWTNDLADAPLQQGWYQAVFTFTNSGTASVSVADLRFSCDCTVYQFNSGTAKPNASATLTVKVQSDSRHNVGKDLDFYAIGGGTTPKKLTMRLVANGEKK